MRKKLVTHFVFNFTGRSDDEIAPKKTTHRYKEGNDNHPKSREKDVPHSEVSGCYAIDCSFYESWYSNLGGIHNHEEKNANGIVFPIFFQIGHGRPEFL
jgi:hypothetical protein